MRSGLLDSVITIQTYSNTVNDYGTPVVSWTDLATVRAQILQASTEEFLKAGGATDQTAVIFRTRWLDGVTTACRVVYDGTFHNIKELKEIGRAKGLDIRTVMQGEVAA